MSYRTKSASENGRLIEASIRERREQKETMRERKEQLHNENRKTRTTEGEEKTLTAPIH